jgi:hypothetical protein
MGTGSVVLKKFSHDVPFTHFSDDDSTDTGNSTFSVTSQPFEETSALGEPCNGLIFLSDVYRSLTQPFQSYAAIRHMTALLLFTKFNILRTYVTKIWISELQIKAHEYSKTTFLLNVDS